MVELSSEEISDTLRNSLKRFESGMAELSFPEDVFGDSISLKEKRMRVCYYQTFNHQMIDGTENSLWTLS